MNFNSVDFLIYLPIVLILYFVMPKKLKGVVLLAASLFFYMYWNYKLIVLILFTTAVSYFSAIIIEKSESAKKRKLFLTLTLISCFGVLFFFKYFNFASDSIASLIRVFGGNTPDFALQLMLPVGISFYTFQTLSYVIDVYRGDIKAERSFIYYALFVSFFPQLVAGPIERPENLLPQLKEPHAFSFDNLSKGIGRIARGFFKKVALADFAAVYVNSVYNNVESSDGTSIIIATVLFALQIYGDFSGYTDIATGCAKIMGITLMKNFDMPYTALSIRDFWSRWHISLSSWLRDYLYIPLGGNRCSKVRHFLNILIVFLASGLWHGAKWTFVLWGGLHGLYQIIGALTYKGREGLYKKLGINTKASWFLNVRRVFTFLLVCFSWIFFRANSTQELMTLLGKLFDFSSYASIANTLSFTGLTVPAVIALVIFAVITFVSDKALENDVSDSVTNTVARNASVIFLLWIVALMWVMFAGQESSFIYFQF